MRNIIFDFGGVLVNLDRKRCIDAFTRIGAGAIAGYVDECRQEDLFHDLEVGDTGVGQFCDAVRQACGGCNATDEDICGAWDALLTGIPRRRLDKLAELKRDFRLVLLSNTNPIHWRKAVDDYFTQGGLNVNYYFEKTYDYSVTLTEGEIPLTREAKGKDIYVDGSYHYTLASNLKSVYWGLSIGAFTGVEHTRHPDEEYQFIIGPKIGTEMEIFILPRMALLAGIQQYWNPLSFHEWNTVWNIGIKALLY